MDIRRIGVLGAGIMGHGIAQVCATAGFDVVLRDVEDRYLKRGLGNMEKSLAKLTEKGKLTPAQSKAARARIRPTTRPEDLNEVDFVIEAVPENLDLKRETFDRLDKLCPPSAIFASNTSQLSIAAIASATGRRDRFIGMHWFNPPPLMALIEVVRTPETSEETLRATVGLSRKLGKEPVVCKDSVGFITTRAINAFRVECMRIADEGIASIEDIDKAIKLAFNHPMGPFELADFAGLDTVVAVEENLHRTYGERFRPPDMLRKLVSQGHLGRKSGKGFHDYTRKK